MPGTVHLHRVLTAPPEKVYRAFVEADALSQWMPPSGFCATVHQLDATVGGSYKMSFRNFSTGHTHSFGGKFVEMEPGVKLVHTDAFDDPNLPGELLVTVNFKEVMCGTEVTIKQEGLPDAIPVEMCYLGWQDSLNNLAKLVEPNIP